MDVFILPSMEILRFLKNCVVSLCEIQLFFGNNKNKEILLGIWKDWVRFANYLQKSAGQKYSWPCAHWVLIDSSELDLVSSICSYFLLLPHEFTQLKKVIFGGNSWLLNLICSFRFAFVLEFYVLCLKHCHQERCSSYIQHVLSSSIRLSFLLIITSPHHFFTGLFMYSLWFK